MRRALASEGAPPPPISSHGTGLISTSGQDPLGGHSVKSVKGPELVF